MNKTLQRLLLNKPPIIPKSVKPNVLAWWDARKRNDVVYGLTNITPFSSVGWTRTNGVLSTDGDIRTLTADGSGATATLVFSATNARVTGVSYYVTLYARVTNANCANISLTIANATAKTINNPTENVWYPLTGAKTATTTGDALLTLSHSYADAETANGKAMEVRYFITINQSTDIGAGNEPTATEMDAILAAHKAASKVKYVLTEDDVANLYTIITNYDMVNTESIGFSSAAKLSTKSVTHETLGEFSYWAADTDSSQYIGTWRLRSTDGVALRIPKGTYANLAAAKAALAGTEIWYELESLYWEGTRQVKCNPDRKYYWYDYSGNGRHMKLNNFAYSGASGWQVNPAALGTDGVDDYGIYSNATAIAVNTPFSLVFFGSIPSLVSVGSHLAAIEGSDGFTAMAVRISSTNEITGYVRSTVDDIITSGITAVANKKYCIIVTRGTGTNCPIKLYLNGQLVGSGTATGDTFGLKYTTYIGYTKVIPAYVAENALAVAPINKELSAAEVYQIFQANRKDFGL